MSSSPGSVTGRPTTGQWRRGARWRPVAPTTDPSLFRDPIHPIYPLEGPLMDVLERAFGVRKPVIAMLHFPALPGRPHHDKGAGIGRLVDVVARDLTKLQAAGVDGVLFCNEADLPYQLKVGPEVPSAMAAVIGQLKGDINVPFGVNILWDAVASLALARATGARFIREVMTGVYESDLGMITPAIGEIAGYRTMIGADDVLLFDNVMPEFASAIGS